MLQIIGRITDNATVNTTQSGKIVINFTLALNDDYRDKEGNKVQQVTYIRCAYWAKSESVGEMLTKGKTLEAYVRLFPSAYTNKKGEAVGEINATVRNFKIYGGGNTTAATVTTPTAARPATVEPVDDLPF